MTSWNWKKFFLYFFIGTAFFFLAFWLLNLVPGSHHETLLQLLARSAVTSLLMNLFIEGIMRKEFKKQRPDEQ